MTPAAPAALSTVFLLAVLVGLAAVAGALLWYLLLDPRPGHGRAARHGRHVLRRAARRVVVRVVLVLAVVRVLG